MAGQRTDCERVASDPVLSGVTALSHVPSDERPRERLLARGSRSVSDAELVAILLRSGSRRASAVELARGVLDGCGGLMGLARADADGLRRRGLGAAMSAAVLAAIEIGRRVARAELPLEDPLRSRRWWRATSACATAAATRRSWARSSSTVAIA